MDYTTIEKVKQEIHAVSGSSVDDALLATMVTTASRAWDRICTMVPDAVDYFALEDVTDETLTGQVDWQGQCIHCFPHKPIVNSVASFSYQASIVDTLYTVDPSRIDIRGGHVIAYPSTMQLNNFPSKCRITISYNGGLAVSGSGMPYDMQEAVTLLAIRFYREAETGVTDQIGVAELSTMIYTKAIPARVSALAEFYKRRAGWRYVA